MSKNPSSKQEPRISAEKRAIVRHWRESVPKDRLAHLVRDVARAQQRELQQLLAAKGVSFGHWSFLRVLWTQDGLNQKELSLQVGVMEPTTFAAVTAMEKLGYVQRRQMAGNRKNSYVFLTPTGAALEQVLVPLAEQVNALSVAGIKGEEVTQLRALLLKMMVNLTG